MANQSNNDPPLLGGTKRDLLVSGLKGAVGAIPGVGSIISEIVGKIIPEQRIQRLEDYVRYLNDRLQNVDSQILEAHVNEAENVDLFEDGAMQSVRALSDTRRVQIAELVAYGISGGKKDRLEAKRLLNLLKEIDDDQIVILTSHLTKHSHDEEFFNKHRAVLQSPLAHLGSSNEERETSIIAGLAKDHLIKLGLLNPGFKSTRKGELPEFDTETGMMKVQYYRLSALGQILLTRLGIAESGKF
jgi:hypothetical protein